LRTKNRKRNGIFFYSIENIGIAFIPFYERKWQFSIGLSHQFMPDASFLRGEYSIFIIGPPAISIPILDPQNERLKNQPLSLFGYYMSLGRNIYLQNGRAFYIRSDFNFFLINSDVVERIGKPKIATLSAGINF
jgi:hypothetical protein